MVAAAQARGLNAHVADAQALDFNTQFDAVFSNAALHWMLDPEAVASGVFRALVPGGRFVGELGGEGNITVSRAGVREEQTARGYPVPADDPYWLPSDDRSEDGGVGKEEVRRGRAGGGAEN